MYFLLPTIIIGRWSCPDHREPLNILEFLNFLFPRWADVIWRSKKLLADFYKYNWPIWVYCSVTWRRSIWYFPATKHLNRPVFIMISSPRGIPTLARRELRLDVSWITISCYIYLPGVRKMNFLLGLDNGLLICWVFALQYQTGLIFRREEIFENSQKHCRCCLLLNLL